MNNKKYCTVSGVIFAVICLMHIWRYILDLPVQIGVWQVPRSLSLIGALGAGLMAAWAFAASRPRSAREPVLT